jgi:hypothetical protein
LPLDAIDAIDGGPLPSVAETAHPYRLRGHLGTASANCAELSDWQVQNHSDINYAAH